MVRELQKENPEGKIKFPFGAGKTLYQCEECGFHYQDKEWAKKCEAWCKEHKSCNIEITRHAVHPVK